MNPKSLPEIELPELDKIITWLWRHFSEAIAHASGIQPSILNEGVQAIEYLIKHAERLQDCNDYLESMTIFRARLSEVYKLEINARNRRLVAKKGELNLAQQTLDNLLTQVGSLYVDLLT